MSGHSQEFVDEMKQRLLEEQQQLQKELGQLAHKDNADYQADYPEYGRNDEENASEVADFTARNATTEAAETRLKEVTEALERIASGTYGVTSTGDVIPEARLQANPAANSLVAK